MLRTWLRRWLGLIREAPTPTDPQGSLEMRMYELEQHVDFLHGALRKLRGRVTGGLRADPAPDGNGGDPVSDAHAADTPVNRQWALAQLEARGRGVKPT